MAVILEATSVSEVAVVDVGEEGGHGMTAGIEAEETTAISITGIEIEERKGFLCRIPTSVTIEAGIEIDGTETAATTATISEAEDHLLHKEGVAHLTTLIVMGLETVEMGH
jgi:hypothetical protein